MLNSLLQQFQQFWQQRAPREQTLLSLGAAFLICFFLYFVLLAPAWQGHKKMQQSLPELRQQQANLQALLQQYQSLSGQTGQSIAPVSREVLTASLNRFGLSSSTLGISDEVVRLQIPKAHYSELMEWLTEMQRAHRLAVDEIKIQALADAQQVSASISLRQQTN